MNTQKLIELKEMIKYCGCVSVTILENGKMTDEIECTSVEEVETLVNMYGTENVYF